MDAPASAAGFDPERTRVEEGTPAGGQLRRGSVLAGKYRLEMLLGEGGMGFVWSAYHLELELPVALKLLRTGPKNEKLSERLRLEARAAAHLVDPSIVRVFDIARTDDGDPFIVMELLTGESLASVLSSERLSATRAVQLLLPIAEGVALAHSKDVVHRDIKPANVFFSTDGGQVQPKLFDFGIAKLKYASLTVARLTENGTILGSPNYMSPEQVRGDDVDYRTDIWSFCVVLYRAVTGTLPFKGKDQRTKMESIINDAPAPIALENGVDERLAQLISWGLNKDPMRRPGSMRELGRELAHWLLTQGVPDDATGALLASKWLGHQAAPTLVLPRRSSVPPRKMEPARGTMIRGRRWVLLTAAAMLIASGSVAWTDSTHPAPLARTSLMARARTDTPLPKPTSRAPALPATAPASAPVHPEPPATTAPTPRAVQRTSPSSQPRRERVSRLPF